MLLFGDVVLHYNTNPSCEGEGYVIFHCDVGDLRRKAHNCECLSVYDISQSKYQCHLV